MLAVIELRWQSYSMCELALSYNYQLYILFCIHCHCM